MIYFPTDFLWKLFNQRKLRENSEKVLALYLSWSSKNVQANFGHSLDFLSVCVVCSYKFETQDELWFLYNVKIRVIYGFIWIVFVVSRDTFSILRRINITVVCMIYLNYKINLLLLTEYTVNYWNYIAICTVNCICILIPFNAAIKLNLPLFYLFSSYSWQIPFHFRSLLWLQDIESSVTSEGC